MAGKKKDTLESVLGLNGPETELLEQLTGKPFAQVTAELLGDATAIPIRTAVASSFILRRREQPDADWDAHWELPVDESVAWLGKLEDDTGG